MREGTFGSTVLISIPFRGCFLRPGGGRNLGIFLQSECQLIHGLGLAAKTGLAMCRKFLLQLLDLIGLRTFKLRGDLHRIVAINPNRPKYPISTERVSDGRGYKMPAETIVMYLQNSYD